MSIVMDTGSEWVNQSGSNGKLYLKG